MVTIRLARTGAKKRPFYHIVATDSRNARDGRYLERLGFYNPVARGKEEPLRMNLERVEYWLGVGAQASDRVGGLVKKYRAQPTKVVSSLARSFIRSQTAVSHSSRSGDGSASNSSASCSTGSTRSARSAGSIRLMYSPFSPSAFCRAVGIPARVVWGCMYTPNAGGSFGQHAWNEVFMGEAGWIPLDTTAREVDFADSGHIRLGVLSSSHIAWNPKELEILDFHAGSQRFGQEAEPGDSAKYQPYLGKYQGPRAVFTVLIQNGSLAIDIPGRMVFELRDPDDQGFWFFKLTEDVNVSFQLNDSGMVTGLTLVNRARIPKGADSAKAREDVPEVWRPYLGRYPVPMEKAEISVLFRRGRLAVDIPGKGTSDLEGPDAEGTWTVKTGRDRFSFVKDERGQVRAMVLHEVFSCPKIGP